MRGAFWFVKWIWAFPWSLMGMLNRGTRLEDWQGRRVYRWKYWKRGYSTAAWPYILLSSHRARESEKLMHHEDQHLHQQMVMGGWIYSIAYGLLFLVLIPFALFNWRKVHKWHPLENDRRKPRLVFRRLT